MPVNDNNVKPVCPHCAGKEFALNARVAVGDSTVWDVIRTEMLGCATIYRFMTCRGCGRNLPRTAYERALNNRDGHD